MDLRAAEHRVAQLQTAVDSIADITSNFAFQSLLQQEADGNPHYPQDWHEFNLCLQLIEMVPGTRDSLPDLAARSPH